MSNDYLVFEEGVGPRGRITRVWTVLAASDRSLLGHVSWHSPWRRYCFFPAAGSIWSPDCLDGVAAFCRRETKARHSGAQGREDIVKNPTRYRALLDKHSQVLTEAVDALLAAPGPFEVEAEGSPGRLLLTTRGGTRAEVDLRGVVWGTDGPPVQDAKWT